MRYERLDLNLLVALDALIEDRSVSSAARRLCLSQPALSGALNRLRDFFGDDLLVQSGRQMMLTRKAEELRGPVREALMLIKAKITTPLVFDPSTAVRQFNIVASDYAFSVLVSQVIAEAAQIAPGLSFEVEPPGTRASERFERGEADLMLTISSYVQEGHPHVPLYTDEHAVISWSEGAHKEGLTPKSFFSAGHVVAFFGRERHPAFTETYFTQQGINRKIEVRLPSFSALPRAVVGTDRLATMYRRHAEHFAGFLPITIHEPPVFLPTIQEEVQWHDLRSGDAGLKWLVELVRSHGRRMSNTVPEPRQEQDNT
jgi:LysR family transcriptional regulator, nod-box dependent transcriptional activator